MSETPVATDRTRLRIERQLPAPVEEVFAAWTDPQMMARWLSPTGQAEVEAEVRVDGRFRVVMIGEDMRLNTRVGTWWSIRRDSSRSPGARPTQGTSRALSP